MNSTPTPPLSLHQMQLISNVNHTDNMKNYAYKKLEMKDEYQH